MPKDSLFPSDEPVGYAVWHKHGDYYKHVASVESNALGAMLMTTHGFMGYERWQDNPGVTAMPGEHRSTTIGDVLVGRDRQPLEITAEEGLRLKPISLGTLEAKEMNSADPLPPGRWQMTQHSAASDYGADAYTLWPQGAIVKGISEADARLLEAAPVMRDALKLAQQALNTAPRFRVGETDSYKIASAVDKALAAADPPRRQATIPDSSHRAQFRQRDPDKDLGR
jgi:hypothetical protein